MPAIWQESKRLSWDFEAVEATQTPPHSTKSKWKERKMKTFNKIEQWLRGVMRWDATVTQAHQANVSLPIEWRAIDQNQINEDDGMHLFNWKQFKEWQQYTNERRPRLRLDTTHIHNRGPSCLRIHHPELSHSRRMACLIESNDQPTPIGAMWTICFNFFLFFFWIEWRNQRSLQRFDVVAAVVRVVCGLHSHRPSNR